MTVRKVYQVLGLPIGAEKNEIKKKYRELMMQVHPNIGLLSQKSYRCSAQEINNAYAVLMKEREFGIENNFYDGKHHASKDKKNVAWDAPVNENGFMEREVLQYMEDYDGAAL